MNLFITQVFSSHQALRVFTLNSQKTIIQYQEIMNETFMRSSIKKPCLIANYHCVYRQSLEFFTHCETNTNCWQSNFPKNENRKPKTKRKNLLKDKNKNGTTQVKIVRSDRREGYTMYKVYKVMLDREI